ncbi:hypothetical protein HDU92_002241 [Lobulomyces angularis]|nr:hypothetical protein HDU92_002241 [Lobulomyces angularis]
MKDDVDDIFESGLSFLFQEPIVAHGELGSGTGLVGVISSLKSCSKIILTDYNNTDLILNLKKNLDYNLKQPEESLEKLKLFHNNYEVAGLTWGDDLNSIFKLLCAKKLDKILMADTFWIKKSHESLIKSLKEFAHLNSLMETNSSLEITCVFGLHSGKSVFTDFLNLCVLNGFKVNFKKKFKIPLFFYLESDEKRDLNLIDFSVWENLVINDGIKIFSEVDFIDDSSERSKWVYWIDLII